MKWRRLWSLRRWTHVFQRISGYLVSSQVKLGDKLLFVIPALLYWVLPDIMPLVPIDDIGFTMLLMNGFVARVERKYPHILREHPGVVRRA
ncbi:hypothetical protein JCM10914A_04230 [Paenibacillus sp. JCM 10914]|uniref:hypothetical protein n=1 Tax=Paenibacillus sp. JCM 10914 TaxID=1236974 RepID=UPI0003CC2749|nr:hypothetical protein [Paenibacillus sp. JCM 10914]GAE07894.1 hypothetical protein JCM10914_4142 [Paenibacillus sp. JCM 10914]